MRTDTQAIRDRLLAVLQTAGGTPMTTQEVCAAAGPYYERRPGCHAWQHDNTSAVVKVVECTGTDHLYEIPLYVAQRGYSQLTAMHRQGLVLRHHTAGDREVSWSIANPADPEDLAMLEQMWQAEGGEQR